MKNPFPKRVLSILTLASLCAACTTQAPPPSGGATAPASSAPTQAAPAPPTSAAKAASPAPAGQASPTTAGSPAAAAKAAPVEPKGRIIYGSHVALSPIWLDPMDAGATVSDFVLLGAVHDGLVRPLPGNPMAPSLAESYEIAPDFKSATFKLRPNIKFHNGEPVTPADVKFSFENYRGPNAKILKDAVAQIETPDARTVIFRFKEPFLDFMTYYGTWVAPAGWIVPAKYYQEVGPDGFKQKPIGAGPYKFVRQQAGNEVEFEANRDYWRKVPSIQTLIVRSIPDTTTRVASLEAGEIDFAAGVPVVLRERLESNPQIKLKGLPTSVYTLIYAGREKPTSPFADAKVRQAVSLGLDREALATFYTGGLGPAFGGLYPESFPGALAVPVPAPDPARAKQLLAEAGYPNGLDAGTLTAYPPNTPLAEVIQTQLQQIGIRTRIESMERAAYAAKQAQGPSGFADGIVNIPMSTPYAGISLGQQATCKGSLTQTCIPEVDEMYQRYASSTNPAERTQLLKDIQKYLLDNHIFVPFLLNVFVVAMGPRIANDPAEVMGSMLGYFYAGPWEDIRLKE